MLVIRYKFGTLTDIVAGVTEIDGIAFTIESTTVSIHEEESGVAIRSNVAASFDTAQVYFHEDFTTANGYKEGTCYLATFKINITRGAVTFREKAEVHFTITAVADE